MKGVCKRYMKNRWKEKIKSLSLLIKIQEMAQAKY